MKIIKIFLWNIAAILMLCGFAACEGGDKVSTATDVSAIADQVWAFSKSHPDGFTLDIHTMTEPTEGIAVSYAATQGSHSRHQLDSVVSHAMQHDGYVGGWYNTEDSLYYFDSNRLFPESALDEAIQFGKENGQHSIFIISTSTDYPLNDQ